jgi:Lipocalin-like domain
MRRIPHTAERGLAAVFFIMGALIAGPVFAGDSNALVGNWKLVSWQVVTGNETQDPFGSHPKGYLI